MHTVHLLRVAASLVVSLVFSGQGFAAGETALSGTVMPDADTCLKGTSGADCALNFAITGPAAKMIYDSMKAKGKMQECTGNVEKFDGSGMHCSKGKTAAEYSCDFSYAISKHQFTAGPDGC